MIDLTEWANGSHNSFGDAIYMAALTTAWVLAVGVVVWRLGKLILHATHRLPQDAKPLSEDTGFVVCLAFAVSFGMLLTDMGAWNPQTVRENARRTADGNMLKKYIDDNRKVS